jgi:poly(ADP-ribose) glycohydrolase ARH3
MRPVSQEQFLGCLLGQAVGDALGAPYEGLLSEHIYYSFGPPNELVGNPSGDTLYYTDDTEMMIGVAETLIEHGEIIEDALCRAFVDNYHPERGYGRGARQILEAMGTGGDWRSLAATVFPGGSLGNGAAMRAAPIGIIFHADLDKVAEQARLSALPTHLHPIGIEGAQLLAMAVALAARGSPFDRKAFYEELIARCKEDEFRWQLGAASKLRRKHTFGFLGNSLEAHRSVVSAIACFTVSPDSFEDAIARAIGMGNDTDTLAAMAGAISGAHLGVGAIPSRLIGQLEEQGKGGAYLRQLAMSLYQRCRG